MTDLFDIRLWLYPGANPDDPDSWGPPEDISSYVRHPGNDGGQVISYSGGKGDEAPSVDAGNMTLTLDNRDGRFSTDNRLGPYYGELDINTPIHLGVAAFTDSFTRVTSNGWGTVNAVLGQSWTVTGSASQWATDGTKATVIIPAANSAYGTTANNANARDMDITTTVIPAAVATGGKFAAGIRLRSTDTLNQLVSILEFDLAGALTLNITRWVAGAVNTLEALVLPAVTYSAGQRWKLRVQADGAAIRAKAWPEASVEPDWQVTVSDTTATGSIVGFYLARYAGNTNSGVTPVLSVDDFAVISIEFTGSVVSWPLRWDKSGNNSWAPITAAGILRRITQGTYPLQSPLRRQLAATADVTGYWPLEDGANATQFSSTIRGQFAATFNGVTPAADNTLVGGGPAPTTTTTSSVITMATRVANNGTGMSAMFLAKLGSLTPSDQLLARVRCSRGPARQYTILVNDTQWTLQGFDDSGSQVMGGTQNWPTGVDPTDWIAWQLETETGLTVGNTDATLIIHQVGSTSYWANAQLVAGTTNTNVSAISLHGPQGTSFAHVWLGKNTLPFVTNSFSLVSSGYAGETAADRFARVCDEAGIPAVVRPGDSERMGPQPQGGTLAVLRACVETDYGVLAERGSGLEFIPRTARWNAATAMSISVAAGQIDEAPEPVRDDQRLRNKWTITRDGGGEGVAEDTDNQAKHGIWEDSATLYTFDDSVLENHAGFRVYVGTGSRLRWPRVKLNFARNQSLLPTWRTKGYGWRFGITTGLVQVDGNEPDLIMEGFRCELWPNGWTAELNCSDARIWRAAVTDDTGILGRADLQSTTTSALINDSTLSIPITTATGYVKPDNTASLWTGGVDFYVGGERVTVTSITNGVGQAQTLNCSARGVGGYASSHPSGTEVRLWDPAVVAL